MSGEQPNLKLPLDMSLVLPPLLNEHGSLKSSDQGNRTAEFRTLQKPGYIELKHKGIPDTGPKHQVPGVLPGFL